jgi:hypothetical protein
MLLTLLSSLGRLAWPAIAGLVPQAGPKLTLGAIAGLLALIVIGGPAGAVWLHMRGEVKATRTACDLTWQNQLLKEKQSHADAIAAARLRAEQELPTPDAAAERLQLCRKSPTCRDGR